MEKKYYGNIIVVAAFLVWFTAWGSFTTFSIFLKPISIETGWDRAGLALAFSLSSLVQAVCALGMGKLTDKVGPRIIVTVFGSFIALCFFLLSKVTALWQFQVVYAVIGAIGLSTATIPIMTTIARWFSEKRGIVTGIVQSGMGFGGLIFAPLTGWLILNYDWRTAFLFLSLITLPLIIISGVFLKRDPGDRVNQHNKLINKVENHENKSTQDAGLSLKEALKTSQFWMIAGMFFSFGFCRATFIAHTAAYVQDLGFSLSDGANVMAVLTFSSILGRVGVGFLGDRIGCRKSYLITFCTMITALLWGNFTNNMWGIFLFALLFGFSWGGQAVLRFTFSAEMFGLVALGVITGVLGLTEAVAAALGSFIAGYAFDLVGSYEIMFTFGVFISIIGGLLLYSTKPMIR